MAVTQTKQKLDDGDTDEAKKILEWRSNWVVSICSTSVLMKLLIPFGIFFYMLKDSNSSDVSSSVSDHNDEAKNNHDDNDDEANNLDDDDDQENIFMNKLYPRDYKSGNLIEFCELALDYYQDEHPGSSYKFVSGLGGGEYICLPAVYDLEFRARKTDDNSIHNFKACTNYYSDDEPEEELIVNACCRLEDGEDDPPMIKEFTEDLHPKTLSLEGLKEKEVAKFFEYCKAAVTFYNENTGESYELVRIQQVQHCVYRGYEYIFTFHAKKMADAIPETFKAHVNYRARAIEITSCELSSNTELD